MATYTTRGAWRAAQGETLWSEEWLVDASAVSAHDMKASGAATVDGIQIDPENAASYASVLGFDGATGLVMDPTGGDYYSSNATRAGASFLIADAVSGYDAAKDTVALQARMLCAPAPNTASAYFGLGIEKAIASSGTAFFCIRHGYAYGSTGGDAVHAAAYSAWATTAAANFVELVLRPGSTPRARVGTWGGSWPNPLAGSSLMDRQITATTIGTPAESPAQWWTSAAARFVMWTMDYNNQGIALTIPAWRVMKLNLG